MESRVKLLGHAVHPILVTFPLGLLATSVIFDLLHVATGTPRWAEVAFWMMASGVIAGLVAALPGLIDWWSIPRNTRAFKIGLLHGCGNVIVVALFGTSVLLRKDAPQSPSTLAVALAVAGFGLAGITGWLGGELVERLADGRAHHAGLDAPSSLSHRSASS
jgi:uncharacterized membrane protein